MGNTIGLITALLFCFSLISCLSSQKAQKKQKEDLASCQFELDATKQLYRASENRAKESQRAEESLRNILEAYKNKLRKAEEAQMQLQEFE